MYITHQEPSRAAEGQGDLETGAEEGKGVKGKGRDEKQTRLLRIDSEWGKPVIGVWIPGSSIPRTGMAPLHLPVLQLPLRRPATPTLSMKRMGRVGVTGHHVQRFMAGRRGFV